MNRDYTITVIQNEKPPLAAIPVNAIPNVAWILILLGVMLAVMVTIYLVYCAKYQQKLAYLAEHTVNEGSKYRSFNYFRLKECERELEQQILDQDDIKNFL